MVALPSAALTPRALTQAYRSATHFGDGEEVDDVKIASSKCFNSIMLFVLKQVDAIFRGMLSMGEPADDAPGDAAKLPKNSRCAAALRKPLNLQPLKPSGDPAFKPCCVLRHLGMCQSPPVGMPVACCLGEM